VSHHPAQRAVRLAIATASLLTLAIWLAALGHAVGTHGPTAAFRFAPWPVIPLVAIAGWLARRARTDVACAAEARLLPEVRSTAAIVLVALVAYVPTWSLAFVDPEDWYHLIVVRHAARHGLGTALADAWAYLRGHPGMFIRTAQFAVWYVEDALFGGWETGYRLVGLGLHVTTALLVGRIAARVGLSPTAANIAALTFVASPASRALLRDPTGLSELLLGVLYGAALLAWLPIEPLPDRRRPAPGWLRYGLLAALILTRDLSFTFPAVLCALALGRALDTDDRGATGLRAAWGHAWRLAAPTLVVPLVQGALLLGELVLDPTSGRPRPAHPLGEFGQFADGLGLARIAAAFLRDLPRNVLFPIWDKAHEAHLASWVVVASTIWLVLGLRASRRFSGATLAAAVWVAAPMTLVFPFTTWEGPDNVHLLYLSTAGLGLFVASVWAALPRGATRALATTVLAVALASCVAFHLGRAPSEHAASAGATETSRWVGIVDSTQPEDGNVLLIGGTDAGTDRWKTAVLSAFATRTTWRQRYATVQEAWWTGVPASHSRPSTTIAGFDDRGRPTRWHGGEQPTIAGLHIGEPPPAGCRPVNVDGEVPGLCAVEPVSWFRSLREVLLTM
jgi:hypothetical protein